MLQPAHPWRTGLLRHSQLRRKLNLKKAYTAPANYPKHEISPVKYRDTVDLAYTATIPQNGNTTDGALVIMHGLFGSKRNWFSLSKAFHRAMPTRPVYALDMRNHGISPRAIPMTYEAMAADVIKFIETKGLKNVALLGHSMGGKTAMTLALSQAGAQHLSHLIVADISPVRAGLLPEFVRYITAMQHVNDLPPSKIKTRTDDLSIRQFLLTNLHVPTHSRKATPAKQPDRLYFTLPLSTLRDAIPSLGDFPYDWRTAEREGPQWTGKTLVVKEIPALKACFPNLKFEVLDTGHWVHAEKPNEFKKLVVDFLSNDSP
ncbi:Alpha/Beta hydrolase protein [Cyathus striatus]|nr:Alpha/Beta hydrolase protein [Cyathus striatus]